MTSGEGHLMGELGEPLPPRRPRPPYRTVAYGFAGGNASGRWVMSPQNAFRPSYLLVWGVDAFLTSFLVAGDEQFSSDPTLGFPVELLQPNVTIADVLSLTRFGKQLGSGLGERLRQGPVTLIGEPLATLPIQPHGIFPTCPLGGEIDLRWRGGLSALLLVGPEPF